MMPRAMLAAWILGPKCRASVEEVYYFFMNRIPAQKQSHIVARFDRDRQSCGENEAPGGAGSTSIQTYTGRAIFQGIIFQHKFLNRV